MATLQPNEFSSYILTRDEYSSGMILNQLQKQSIQNEIAQIAQVILNTQFDPNNAIAYGLEKAYNQGKLDVLKYLIDCSESQEKEVAESIQTTEEN